MTAAHASGARRAPPRNADVPADEPVAAEGWRAGAQQWLWRRIAAMRVWAGGASLAAAAAALDRSIALLHRLRQRASGAEHQDEHRESHPPEMRATAARARNEPAAEAPVAPLPPRRVRIFLVYLGVMLAGGVLGTALAYGLLAQSLKRQAVELRREQAKASGYSKSLLEMKTMLAQQRAQGAEAHPASDSPKPAGDSRGTRASPTGPADCVLDGADVRTVLAGCIAGMNRK